MLRAFEGPHDGCPRISSGAGALDHEIDEEDGRAAGDETAVGVSGQRHTGGGAGATVRDVR